jgi:hypothetical protein
MKLNRIIALVGESPIAPQLAAEFRRRMRVVIPSNLITNNQLFYVVMHDAKLYPSKNKWLNYIIDSPTPLRSLGVVSMPGNVSATQRDIMNNMLYGESYDLPLCHYGVRYDGKTINMQDFEIICAVINSIEN